MRELPPLHLLPFTPASLMKLGGGRNSRVFKAIAADGQTCLVKEYFKSAHDPRDRLHTEWTACTFLHAHGMTCVPRPLACDESENVAVYEYIEGSRPAPSSTVEAVFPLGDFWAALYALRGEGLRVSLPPASDACFCLADIARQLDDRCRRLLRVPQATAAHREMLAMVKTKLLPLVQSSLRAAEIGLRNVGVTPSTVLADSWRMPSPSDFGFHNAVQRADGRLFFVDFEYFGMDDPVKLLADTCLHPGMTLTVEQRLWLARRMQSLARDGDDAHFGMRFAYISPLWRCKWCCIVLNAFVPDDDARRVFAQGDEGTENLLYQQLAKAQYLTENEHHEHERIFLTRP